MLGTMIAAHEPHHQVTGAGTGMTQVDGMFAGPLYQKQPRPVVNSSTVDAGKVVEDSANFSRQHYTALPFATVVDYAYTTNISIC